MKEHIHFTTTHLLRMPMSLNEFLAQLNNSNVRLVFESPEEYQEFWKGIEERTRAQQAEYAWARSESERLARLTVRY